jgi:hypothetical protein
MMFDLAVGLLSAAVALLVYYTVSHLAGRRTIPSRVSRPSSQGLPVKASRGIQQLSRSVKCLVGAHQYLFNWNAPYFTQAARCRWCGHKGPWRRIP